MSSTYKDIEELSGDWEDLPMGAVNLIPFISIAGPRFCWPSRKFWGLGRELGRERKASRGVSILRNNLHVVLVP